MRNFYKRKVLSKKNKHINLFVSQFLAFFLLIGIAESTVAQPLLLDPVTHPKFVQKLPVIKDLGLRIDLTAGNPVPITVNMVETTQKLGLFDPLGNQLKTRVWGYQFPGLPVTYPGATIVAMEGAPINIRWNNMLPGHFLPIDASLHMAHPLGMDPLAVAAWYAAGNVPTVAHLHGGHTETASDGLPEAWFNQNFAETGAYYVKPVYKYHNDQEAATLWYHDHALGITRLNVYAGLAGFYLLRDVNENDLIANGTLPSGDYEIEMVIQDRDFDATGQLFLPSVIGDPFFGGTILTGDLGGVSPSIVAEYFGSFILVNGKAWPKFNAKQTKYRFRMLNGSDSRFYRLKIQDALGVAIPFMQIGTDDALLPTPVPLTELLIAPGERADLVVDFTGLKGFFTMVNIGPDEPFKGLTALGENSDGAGGVLPAANPLSSGQIMQFKVGPGRKPPTFSVVASTTLRPPIEALIPTNTRQLVLFEGADDHGRLQPMLGTMHYGS